jgi:hypothetical protein
VYNAIGGSQGGAPPCFENHRQFNVEIVKANGDVTRSRNGDRINGGIYPKESKDKSPLFVIV